MSAAGDHAMCLDCRRSTNDSRIHPVVHAAGCPQLSRSPSYPYGTVTEHPDLMTAKRNLKEGKWHPMDALTLEQLTDHAWGPQGGFSMRLLAAEVWRLRKENQVLRTALPTGASGHGMKIEGSPASK